MPGFTCAEEFREAELLINEYTEMVDRSPAVSFRDLHDLKCNSQP